MARTNPFEFLQQVRTEVSKVTWPTRRETVITTIMVLVMSVAAALFFLAADRILSQLVTLVLGIGPVGGRTYDQMAMRWYIVHAYSNFERKVAESIKERAAAAGLGDMFEEVLVPMEEVVEMRRGRKVSVRAEVLSGLRAGEDGAQRSHLSSDQGDAEGHGLSRHREQADRRSPRRRRGASCSRCRKASSGRSRRSPSRSASRCAWPTGRSPRSTASSRKSTRSGRGSRWRCRFSAGRRRSSWNTDRSRSCKR